MHRPDPLYSVTIYNSKGERETWSGGRHANRTSGCLVSCSGEHRLLQEKDIVLAADHCVHVVLGQYGRVVGSCVSTIGNCVRVVDQCIKSCWTMCEVVTSV